MKLGRNTRPIASIRQGMVIRKLLKCSLGSGITALDSFSEMVGVREVLPWSSMMKVKVCASKLMKEDLVDSILVGVQYHSETYSPFTSFLSVVGLVMMGCWRGIGQFRMGIYLGLFFFCSSFSALILSFSVSSSNLFLSCCCCSLQALSSAVSATTCVSHSWCHVVCARLELLRWQLEHLWIHLLWGVLWVQRNLVRCSQGKLCCLGW